MACGKNTQVERLYKQYYSNELIMNLLDTVSYFIILLK